MTSVPFPPAALICLPVARGEEQAAGVTLAAAHARSTSGVRIVVVRLGCADPAQWLPNDLRLAVEVQDAAIDARGPLFPALRLLASIPVSGLFLLRPGIEPPQAWDSRLQFSAAADATIGSVSPQCVDGEGLSDDAVASLDRWLAAGSRRQALPIARPWGGCFYLRGAALAAVAPRLAAFDGTADAFLAELARWIAWQGYSHVAADHVVVIERGTKLASPLGRSAALAQALERAVQPPHAAPAIPGLGPPVQLHVVHNWSGGVHRWLRDYCQADRHRENLVLKPIGTAGSFGEGLALYRTVDDVEPCACYQLDPPIAATAITHLGYRHALQEIIACYGVGAIVVSSLVGQSLDVLHSGLPTLLVAHDYYPLCAAVNLVFRGVCTSCDDARLAACLAGNERNRVAKLTTGGDWSALRQRLVASVLSRRIPLVVPSASVREHLTAIEPRLAAAEFHVIPHGLDTTAWQPIPPGTSPHARPRAVVLGRLSAEKGLDLLADVLPELTADCDLTLLGCGEPGQRFVHCPGVTVIPKYVPRDLPGLLAQIQPDIGLLLSTCPETFSYTLSELMALGIPPVATCLGSFAERIVAGQNGFLAAPEPADVVRVVRELCRLPDRLAEVRRQLQAQRLSTPEAMVASYHAALPVPAFCATRYAQGGDAAATPALSATPMTESRAAFDTLLDRVLSEETFEGLLDRVYQVFCLKVEHTPRLRAWQRPIARAVVGGIYRLLKCAVACVRRPVPRGK